MSPRVLFLVPNPVEAASTRYRILQYLPYLKSAGFECAVSPFLSSDTFNDLYRQGRTVRKSLGLIKAGLRRLNDLMHARTHDVICVSREAMLFGPPVIEWLVDRAARRPIVFDFDDAVFVSYLSPTYGQVGKLLKWPDKTRRILRLSSHVLAGNEYLASYAREHNDCVTILPTVVDLSDFNTAVPEQPLDRRPVIGWIGSHSTAAYLALVRPALEQLARKHDFIFRVIGAGNHIEIPGVIVENRSWSMERELIEFRSLDIGIYPLANDVWTRGKCAFKAIQYMAAGVACVASPVGMNREVITHGVNGLLAESTDEWVHALDSLLEDAELRRKLVDSGRTVVDERYSLKAHAPRLESVLREAANPN